MKIEDLVNKGILDLNPYQPGKPIEDLERELGIKNAIKLASNENPLGPSRLAIDAVTKVLNGTHRYPDGNALRLKECLSNKFKVDINCLTIGNGSNDIIEFIARSFLSDKDSAIYSEHAFAVYPLVVQAVGAEGIEVPAIEYGHDLEEMLKAVKKNTKLIFIANPNNPTGTYLPASKLMRLYKQIPSNVLLVIDSAYAEYVQEQDYSPGIELAKQSNNVIMLRTFSKIYGMGGIRLGWGYFPKEVADILNRVRSPFNVSFVAQAAGLAAIQDDEFVKSSQNHNHRLLKWTQEKLRSLGLIVPDSFGNFVLVRFPNSKNEKDNDPLE